MIAAVSAVLPGPDTFAADILFSVVVIYLHAMRAALLVLMICIILDFNTRMNDNCVKGQHDRKKSGGLLIP